MFVYQTSSHKFMREVEFDFASRSNIRKMMETTEMDAAMEVCAPQTVVLAPEAMLEVM